MNKIDKQYKRAHEILKAKEANNFFLLKHIKITFD